MSEKHAGADAAGSGGASGSADEEEESGDESDFEVLCSDCLTVSHVPPASEASGQRLSLWVTLFGKRGSGQRLSLCIIMPALQVSIHGGVDSGGRQAGTRQPRHTSSPLHMPHYLQECCLCTRQLGDLDADGEAAGPRRLAQRPLFWLRLCALALSAGLLAAGLSMYFLHRRVARAPTRCPPS